MMDDAMPRDKGKLKIKVEIDMAILFADTLTGPKGLNSKAITVKQKHSTELERPSGNDSFK